MSEGPQVKIRTEWLRRHVAGHVVVSCLTGRENLQAFAGAVAGRRLLDVFCKGKHIFAEFEGGLFLHNHLLMRGSWRRLEGRLLLLPPGTWLALDMGSHTVCNLNGQMLRPETSQTVAHELSRLGPDVMTEPYPAGEIERALRSRDQAIGPALLDQSLVSGLGNIAKSEALHLARVDPRARAQALNPSAVRRLVEAIRRVCQESYYKGGRWSCRIYQRHGQPCATCSRRIVRILQAGRSTYFCPVCQQA